MITVLGLIVVWLLLGALAAEIAHRRGWDTSATIGFALPGLLLGPVGVAAALIARPRPEAS